MTSLVVLVLVLAAALVLAVTMWRAGRRAPSDGGQAALEQAERQREQLQPLIRDLRRRRAENNFTPLIKNALGR